MYEKENEYWRSPRYYTFGDNFLIYQNNKQKKQGVECEQAKSKQKPSSKKQPLPASLIPSDEQSLMGTGTVSDVKVAVGDKVEEGQFLATYDSGVQLTAGTKGTITEVNIKPVR